MISKILTHPADLSVQPLRQNNGKTIPASLSHDAWARNSPKYRHSILHMTHKFICNFVVYRHLIFLFVVVACPHDTVDKISLIGHKEKSLGIFIQPSHWIDPCRIINVFGYCCLLPLFLRAADDSPWFIKKKQYLPFFLFHRFAVQTDHRINRDSLPCAYLFPVHGIIANRTYYKWRSDREAEGARLLSEYAPKGHLGFESLLLRHDLHSPRNRGGFFARSTAGDFAGASPNANAVPKGTMRATAGEGANEQATS